MTASAVSAGNLFGNSEMLAKLRGEIFQELERLRNITPARPFIAVFEVRLPEKGEEGWRWAQSEEFESGHAIYVELDAGTTLAHYINTRDVFARNSFVNGTIFGLRATSPDEPPVFSHTFRVWEKGEVTPI